MSERPNTGSGDFSAPKLDNASFGCEALAIIATMPEAAGDLAGEPLAVGELFTVINQTRRGGNVESANVIVRGVQPLSFTLAV